MVDLRTTYLGLNLRSPLVVSASPLSRDVEGICRLEDAGASAIVLYSLFEEQLRQEEADLDYHLAAGTESFAESLTYFPQASEFHTGPEGYLNHIRKAKASVKIPIIASLNGSTLGGWTKFAAEIERGPTEVPEHGSLGRWLHGKGVMRALPLRILHPVAPAAPFASHVARCAGGCCG